MKRLFALVGAVLAFVAATAASSGASPAGASGFEAFCSDDFGSLSMLTRSGSGRAGPSLREPVLRVGPSDSEIQGSGPKVSSSFAASIPVYFHVIHNGAVGNVSDGRSTSRWRS